MASCLRTVNTVRWKNAFPTHWPVIAVFVTRILALSLLSVDGIVTGGNNRQHSQGLLLPPSIYARATFGAHRENGSMKVTLENMRSHGCRDLLVYCGNAPRCWHRSKINVYRWPDDTAIADLKDLFVRTKCGAMGAELRPNFSPI